MRICTLLFFLVVGFAQTLAAEPITVTGEARVPVTLSTVRAERLERIKICFVVCILRV